MCPCGRKLLLCFAVFVFVTRHIDADTMRTCQPGDFHYEYTECDSQGGRWRVSVPKTGVCTGGNPNAPVRGKGCDFTCESGQFLDLNDTQECKPCPPGTYSLGGGVRFEDWNELPHGLTTKSESFSLSGHRHSIVRRADPEAEEATESEEEADREEKKRADDCSKSTWTPKGQYVASLPGQCAATLTYSANLVRDGYVEFTYQFTDSNTIFHFSVRNEQCQTLRSSNADRYLPETEENEWKILRVNLKSGINLISWKTIGVRRRRFGMPKPVLIKVIELHGVAFTSECTKCRNGTHSDAGQTVCKMCDRNTWAGRGATTCQPCDAATEYAEPGSGACKPKKPCTEDDYFESNTPCDANNQTKKIYDWIKNKICRDDLQGSVKLPPPSAPEMCPPCNPGMEYVGGMCHFCPANHYSSGEGACKECPASTAPKVRIHYKWWQNLPSEANITTSCLSLSERGCVTKSGWVMNRDHVHSGRGHADDAYLILTLKVNGFRGQDQFLRGKRAAVGNVSFVFELDCESKCEFLFMQQSKSRGTSVIEQWSGKQPKQKYVYEVTRTEEVIYTWAFQKNEYEEDETSATSDEQTRVNSRDVAKVFDIEVTNTMAGGAEACEKCPKGSDQSGCIPCPTGHYMDANTTSCKPCPTNTVVTGVNPWGVESCQKCGEGLHTTDNVECVTDCVYTSPDGKQYDFTALSGIQHKVGSRLFTAGGTQYYHYFNISLCAGGGVGKKLPKVTCKDNITILEEFSEIVDSFICQVTLIPPRNEDEEGTVATQPNSLGDILVNITNNGSSMKMMERMTKEGFDYDISNDGLDVHFTYLSELPTSACRKGRTIIITLRCDAQQKGNGTIQLPPSCPDGTCDGCNFHMLWSSKHACPKCEKEDYEVVKGECKDGDQIIHYYPPKHCIILGGEKKSIVHQKCTNLPVPLFWVQSIVAGIVGVGMILIILLLYCWKKNKKLEYKYMKLVQGSSKHGDDTELPPVDSCGLDEGEDDEQFDAVEFKESKGKRFFSRLKNMTKKDFDSFVDINTESSALLQ